MPIWLKMVLVIIICQMIVLIIGFFSLSSIKLEVFINMNFYFGLIFLMAGLFIIISRNGFFDVITNGIRHVFFRKQMELDDEEYRSFSTLLNFSPAWILGSGIILLGLSILSYFLGYGIDS